MSVPGDQERHEILVDLIELRVAPHAAIEAVIGLPWDSDVELVVLTPRSVVALLQRYLRGELSPSDLEAWANAIEGRDDVGMEPGYDKVLRAFMFETANPTLAEAITDGYARRWVARLSDLNMPSSS